MVKGLSLSMVTCLHKLLRVHSELKRGGIVSRTRMTKAGRS